MTDKRHSPLMMGRVEVGAQGKSRNRGWGEGPKSREENDFAVRDKVKDKF